MSNQAAPVTAGENLQAPVLNGAPIQRDPYCEDLGFVCVRQNDAIILVPRSLGNQCAVGTVLGHGTLGQLEPDVLDGIGIDLRTNQIFYEVQQSRGCEQSKYGRANVNRRIVPHACLRETDIEILREILAALKANPNQTVGKIEIAVCRLDSSFPEKHFGKAIQNLLAVGHHGSQISHRIEHSIHHNIPFRFELIPLRRR
jgi:hypothetical protein